MHPMVACALKRDHLKVKARVSSCGSAVWEEGEAPILLGEFVYSLGMGQLRAATLFRQNGQEFSTIDPGRGDCKLQDDGRERLYGYQGF